MNVTNANSMSNSLLQVHNLIFNRISLIEPFGRSILINYDNLNCQVQLAFKHKFMGFEQNLKCLAKSYENKGETRLSLQVLFPCIQHDVNTEAICISNQRIFGCYVARARSNGSNGLFTADSVFNTF